MCLVSSSFCKSRTKPNTSSAKHSSSLPVYSQPIFSGCYFSTNFRNQIFKTSYTQNHNQLVLNSQEECLWSVFCCCSHSLYVRVQNRFPFRTLPQYQKNEKAGHCTWLNIKACCLWDDDIGLSVFRRNQLR